MKARSSGQSVENRISRKIKTREPGWAFSASDLAALGSRQAIDIALHRMEKAGSIRRVIRGVYDAPVYSEILRTRVSPDLDQVAHALARRFGWRVQPSGAAAANLLGLSTQIPARLIYLSDGPNRNYLIGRLTLTFKHAPLKEASLKMRESGLIVQAIKNLGPEGITPEVESKLRRWLPEHLHAKVLSDAKTVTGWVYATLRRIAQAEDQAA